MTWPFIFEADRKILKIKTLFTPLLESVKITDQYTEIKSGIIQKNKGIT